MNDRRWHAAASIESLEYRRLLAGDPYLVEDLHQVPASSLPMNLTEFRSEVFFSAETAEHGRELWRSDGTAEGTAMVSDILPGPDGAYPSQLVASENELYFVANSGDSSSQVWKTDGTEFGTAELAEFDFVHRLVVFEDKLYIVGDGQIWQDDGTESGFRSVDALEHIRVRELFVADDALFIAGRDELGNGIWRWSEEQVTTVLRGMAGSEKFVQLDDDVFIAGPDPDDIDNRRLLWQLRPGSETATLVKTFDAQSIEMITSPTAVLLRVDRRSPEPEGLGSAEIWRTDGTAEGTYRLTFPGTRYEESLSHPYEIWLTAGFPNAFLSLNGDIWSSDGTQAGTIPLPSTKSAARTPNVTAVIGGEQFLFGAALWQTDGTEPGTIKIKDIEGPKYNTQLIGIGDTLYFNGQGEDGSELWKSDGTSEGTRLVRDIRPGFTETGANDVAPRDLVAAGDQLYFTHGDGLWVSDGRQTTTVADVVPVGQSSPFGNVLLFHTRTSLWTSDGTVDGTKPFFEFALQTGRRIPWRNKFVEIDGGVFFFVDSEEFGRELWKTDGTTTGTLPVADIVPPDETDFIDSSAWIDLVRFKDRVFFSVREETRQALWVSDGTNEGTRRLVAFGPPSEIEYSPNLDHTAYPFDIEVVGDRVVFVVNTEEFGRELWSTDGTEAGTERLTDVVEGPEHSITGFWPLLPAIGKTFFVARNGFGGADLWTSDGTKSGTQFVVEIASDIDPSIREGIEFDGMFFFGGYRKGIGYELWRSDGTEDGTELVKDILPGRLNSAPSDFTVFDDMLYFRARSSESNAEVWVTDGTADGTHVLAEVNPGGAGSSPHEIVATSNHLFFTAIDGFHGRELWALEREEKPADFDQDGEVGFSDFLILSLNFGKTEARFADGDADGDQEVTFADFLVLSEHFGRKSI